MARRNSNGIKESTDEVIDFFRVPEYTELSVQIQNHTYKLLQERKKQIEDVLEDVSNEKIEFDKVVEQIVIFGLENNDTFQKYLRDQKREANTRKKNEKKKSSSNGSNKTNPSTEIDEKEVDTIVENIGK